MTSDTASKAAPMKESAPLSGIDLSLLEILVPTALKDDIGERLASL